jgi:DeoR/GlpR family transcriptional regulator of sugar metabolism
LLDAELLRPDLCVLGACGIAAEIGVTALHLDDAEFKRVVAGRSRTVALAITSEKLGTVAAHDVVPLNDVGVMAVEYDVDEAALVPYAASGMKILRAAADRD